MKRQSVLLVLCVLLLSGCGVPFVGTWTPEQAAQQAAVGIGGKPATIDIAGKRQLSNGKIAVLYRSNTTTPDGQPIKVFGHTIVERAGLGWTSNGGSAGGGPDLPPASQLVNMSFGGGSSGTQSHAILYGETLTPDVVAVEATFDNGQTLRDSATDGVFVVYSDNANAVCSMRVLGANDAVLRTDTLTLRSHRGKKRSGHQIIAHNRKSNKE